MCHLVAPGTQPDVFPPFDPTVVLAASHWADDPWFLKELPAQQERFLETAGFPIHVRRIAVSGLRQLFPLDVCRSMARDPRTIEMVAPLYQRAVHMLPPLLELGEDLGVIRLADDDPLLARLRNPDESWGACTEITIWANFKRTGLDFEREPAGRGDKKPDFLVYLDYSRFFVEVKTNPISRIETNAQELRTALCRFLHDFGGAGRAVRVLATPALEHVLEQPDAKAQIMPVFSNLYAELDACWRAVCAADHAPGTYDAGTYLS